MVGHFRPAGKPVMAARQRPGGDGLIILKKGAPTRQDTTKPSDFWAIVGPSWLKECASRKNAYETPFPVTILGPSCAMLCNVRGILCHVGAVLGLS